MKTALRFLLFILFLLLIKQQLHAQCTVSNIVVQNTRNVVPGAGTCTVTFDVSFTIENNNGNKYIFIHAWLQSQYPDYFECVEGSSSHNGAIHAPEAADLVNSFLNIAIDNSGEIPAFLTVYPPDNSVSLGSVTSIVRTVLPDGSGNFMLKGVTVTLPVACGTPAVIVADLWSSQSANAQVAHCVNCGIMYFSGYMSVAGLVNCNTMVYNATVTNNTNTVLSGVYNVYADVNHDECFTPPVDTLITGPVDFALDGTVGATFSVTGTLPGANINQGVFLVLTQNSGNASGASRVYFLASTQCSSLPVTFQSFTAKRVSRSNVLLTWETATEINNSGFELQRNVGDDNWITIGQVNSQSVNGNSNSLLLYTYTDINTSNGLSYYRVRQTDFDGRTKFSEIRTVRGDGQSSQAIVYPNPSANGSVRVLLDDRGGNREIVLSDISGHVLRRWKTAAGNTIQIDNLVPGFYTLRVMIPETREQYIEKIIITTGR